MAHRGPRHARTHGPAVAVDLDVAEGDAPTRLVPDLLDAVLDAVSVGVVVHAPDGRMLATNIASRDLLGPRPGETLIESAAARPGEITLPVTHGDGRIGTVLATTVPIAPYGAHVTALVTTLQPDLPADEGRAGRHRSKREDTEENTPGLDRALALAERRLRATLEHSPVGVTTLSLDGRILEVNRAMCRMLGRGPDDVVGTTFAALGVEEEAARESELMARLIAGEAESFDLQRRYLRPGGDSVWADTTLSVVRDEDGTPLHIIVQASDVTQARVATEMLAHHGLHDPLTGLPNRTLGLDRIQKVLDRSRRSDSKVAVLCLDLDRFKVVNDSIGPGHGDAVLVEVAQRLQRALRAGDTAARLSGDEFVVVCEDVQDKGEAVTVAERLLAAVREPVSVGGRLVVPSASVGIAISGPDDVDAMALMRDAGAALHRAQETGSGSWEIVDDEMRRRAVDRLDIEQALRAALAHGQLRLHLQPIVDLARGVIVGREALVRWQHPERGLLAPAWFLPVAEETGLIQELGRWVIEEAARIAAATPQYGYIAVNVSPSQVRRSDLLADVEFALTRVGLHPSRMVIELTESVMLGAAPDGRKQLQQLDDLGVRLVVDDFGTGFSALSHLRDLPVSGIKVDRTFTAGLGRDPQCDRIVEALTGLAHGLGVDIVAEGVETEEQRRALAGFGLVHAQGFLFGRPEPVSV